MSASTNYNVGVMLAARAKEHPERPAIVFAAGEQITFAALDRMSDRFASGLTEQGLSRGDRVLFLGRVDAMHQLLAAVDGVVLSVDTLRAKMDTPLVLLEAMARGVGAIVSDLPPLVELAGLGEGIETVAASDPQALASAMARWSSDPTHRRRMGHGARRTVEQHFTLPRMVEAYEALYREAIHGG